MPEIQITKKTQSSYGGMIVVSNPDSLVDKSTDEMPYTRAEKNKLSLLSTGGGTSFIGTNYNMVYGKGTPTENAAELQNTYSGVINMPRYLGEIDGSMFSSMSFYKGQALGDGTGNYYKILVNFVGDNIGQNDYTLTITELAAKSVRTTVIVAPGVYTFGNTKFNPNIEGVDIVSLTGNADVILDGVRVSANNIYIKGIACYAPNTFVLGHDHPFSKFENCIGGDYSFNTAGATTSGTFINCTGGDYSFGSEGVVTGTFMNCTGGDYSFGWLAEISGTFIDCVGGYGSFGWATVDTTQSTATYIRCSGGGDSFGTINGYSTQSSFYYCTAVIDSGLDGGLVHLYCINENNAVPNSTN